MSSSRISFVLLEFSSVLSEHGAMICCRWTVENGHSQGIITFLVSLIGEQPFWEDDLSRPTAHTAASCTNYDNLSSDDGIPFLKL